MKRLRYQILYYLFVLLLFFTIGLILGPIKIPLADILTLDFENSVHEQVFWQVRLPQLTIAIFSGAALGLSGLLMQAYFQNPLAGPYMLGVHSFSTLFVSLWLLASHFLLGFLPPLLIKGGEVLFSILGSLISLVVLLGISKLFKQKIYLIIFGLILSYFSSSIISLLISISDSEHVKIFLTWSFGSFHNVLGSNLSFYIIIITIFITITFLIVKPLDAILQGEDFAFVSGLDVEYFQIIIILLTGVLTGLVTAYCGPVAFIGIIAPHLARLTTKKGSHSSLLPLTIFSGASLGLLGEIVSNETLFNFSIPLNTSLGIIGSPIILFLILNKSRKDF